MPRRTVPRKRPRSTTSRVLTYAKSRGKKAYAPAQGSPRGNGQAAPPKAKKRKTTTTTTRTKRPTTTTRTTTTTTRRIKPPIAITGGASAIASKVKAGAQGIAGAPGRHIASYKSMRKKQEQRKLRKRLYRKKPRQTGAGGG